MEDRRLPLTDTSAELCALLGQWYPAPARVPLSHSNIECVFMGLSWPLQRSSSRSEALALQLCM